MDNGSNVKHIAKSLPWMTFSCLWIPFIAEMCDEYKINRGKLIMYSMKKKPCVETGINNRIMSVEVCH